MQASSVYFGGGTPSLWKPHCLARVLECLERKLGFAEGIEVSLEANPNAAEAGRLSAFRAAGVNRLSLGVQSFDDDMLRLLGRTHNAREARQAAIEAREAGFENLSLDLLYALPGQSLQQACADARAAAALEPEHVSFYALTLEEEALSQAVPMARQSPKLPSEALSVAMREEMAQAAWEVGLRRYELSNYALPGRASGHNLSYWKGDDYMGLGAGAVGAFIRGGEGRRWFNHRRWEDYSRALAVGALPEAEREVLSKQALYIERAMLGLRLVEGVELEGLCTTFGKRLEEAEALARRWEAEGWAVYASGRLHLTERGMDIHSALCLQLL
jgi:oxygen-independent coproporphyrinogen-3 oxidase